MFQANASMVVRRISDQVSIIDIEGEVNRYAEDLLMDAYTRASEGGTQTILLNFNRLEFMNSSGIGLLVTLLVRVKRQGQRLIAFGLNDHYQQIFSLIRLNEAIQILEDETTAREAAAQTPGEGQPVGNS